MEISFTKRKTLYSYAIAIVLIGVTYVYFLVEHSPAFFTNDEVIMRAIASGGYNGTPDGHLVYIMYPLGWLFSVLYRVAAVNWYGGFMLFTHYLAWIVIIGQIGRFFTGRVATLLAEVLGTVTLVILDYRYVLFHQYTDLSSIIMCAGLLLLLTALLSGCKADYIFSAVFFLLSLWIRKETFLMGIPFILLMLLYLTVTKKCNAIRTVIYAASICALVIASFIINAWAYSSPEWKEFDKVNEARTDLVDYLFFPESDIVADTLAEYGISELEYDVVRSSNYVLSGNSGSEFLSEVYTQTKDIVSPAINMEYIVNLLRMLKENVMGVLFQSYGYILVALLAFTLSLSLINKDYFSVLCTLGIFVYQMAFTLLFIYKGRFPERVSHAFYLIEIVTLFAFALLKVNDCSTSGERTIIRKLMTGTLFTLLIVGYVMAFGKDRVNVSLSDEAEWNPYIEESEQLNAIVKENPDKVFLVEASVGNYLCSKMLGYEETDYSNVIFTSFWTWGSPFLNEKKNDLMESGNIYFVRERDKQTDAVEAYLSSEYGLTLDVVEDSFEGTKDNIDIIKTSKK